MIDGEPATAERAEAPNLAALADTPAPAERPVVRLAGFWVRVGAWAIDAVIVFVCWGLAAAAAGNRASWAGAIAGYIIWASYSIFYWTTSGQTVGHKVAGIRVVRTDGRLLTIGQAFIRLLGEYLSTLPFYAGFIAV